MNSELQQANNIDRLIHEPSRMMIMAILYAGEQASFLYLLRETGLTKGNLSAHLARLETAGYVRLEKGFRGKVPQTVCRLTDTGRAAFREYRAQLKRAVDSLPE